MCLGEIRHTQCIVTESASCKRVQATPWNYGRPHILRLTQCCADSSTDITMAPQPTEAEIQFILDAISDYLTVKVTFLPPLLPHLVLSPHLDVAVYLDV